MRRYVCSECGHALSGGLEDVPEGFECPDCGAPKSGFKLDYAGCKVHVCSMCGFRLDEDRGNAKARIVPGTGWEDIPDSFVCPVCGCPKNIFRDCRGRSP